MGIHHHRISGHHHPDREAVLERQRLGKFGRNRSHGLMHAGRLFDGKGYGGVLSFEIAGADKATAFRFMEALSVCLPATTLGDVYSLVLHPATASHRALTAEERKRVGISDGLVRLSAGIEAVDDIISDLEHALGQE